MRQWSQIPFKTTGTVETPEFALRWEQATPTARFSHSFSVTPTDNLYDNEEESRNTILRILCHYAINSLPDKSLLELVESLKTMIEFYRPISVQQPLIASNCEVRARVGQKITRPVFQIGEE
jgi:hypothetical protein